jgi:hypothetical protein
MLHLLTYVNGSVGKTVGKNLRLITILLIDTLLEQITIILSNSILF